MNSHRDAGRLRLGILGAGRIAQKAIAPAALKARNVELFAAASRDVQRAESLGAKRAYDSYGALLADPDVDAVFITTHNGLHGHLAIEAMRQGKHVLCEKPLSPTVEECERMVDESQRTGMRLMEAFMYRYHPQIAALQSAVKAGRLGKLRHIKAAFHFHLDRADDVRLKPEWGGGALLDVGCYCVNASRLFLGDELSDVTATAAIGGPHGVDMEGSASLAFAGGAKAEISWGFVGPQRQQLILWGSEGEASLNWAYAYRGEPHVLEIVSSDSTDRLEFGQTDTYQLEIEDFAGAILEGREPMLAVDDGLKNARVMERIGAAIRS
jgi:xylose dehydrogenase (NAD/NADP)